MIKRAYELQKDDVFRKCGSDYIVVKRTPERIYYCLLSASSYGLSKDTFIGGKSQEMIEYLGKQVKSRYGGVCRISAHTKEGDFVGEYANQKEAEKELGLYDNYVSKVLRGELLCSKYVFAKIPKK